jgi:hypothetical protein
VAVAGWYTDPSGEHRFRYFDGSGWTERVSDAEAADLTASGSDAPDRAIVPSVTHLAAGRARRPRPLIGFLVVAVVAAICVAAAVVVHRRGGHSATNDAVAVADPVDLKSAPTANKTIAVSTIAFLSRGGRVIGTHESAVAAMLQLGSSATAADCPKAARDLDVGGKPPAVLGAIGAVPDDVLRELLTGEHASEIAALRACGGSTFAQMETLLNEVRRLHDAVSRRELALRAAARS